VGSYCIPCVPKWLRAALLASSALTVVTNPASAQDATWLANPATSNFNSGGNWSGGAVPTGTATFGQSTKTTLTLSASASLDTMNFNAGAPAYTINTGTFNFLTLSGTGIVNNSSNALTINNSLGFLEFDNSASAGNAVIKNTTGSVSFFGTSAAGSAQITTAGGGLVSFDDASNAGNAVITTNAGGKTQFLTNADGGNAQLVANDSGIIDFSGTTGALNNSKVNVGSLAGSGTFNLGANELTVGSNNLSTTVTGTINDGGDFGGTGASLVKVGNGTLTLSGVNTYSGGTTFAGGTVSVASDSNLGATIGGLTFNGGILQITGTAFSSTTRSITWGAGGGGFDIVDAGNTFSLSQAITGTGGLTKLGAGTLLLSGANTYSGATNVNAGSLQAGAVNVFGNNSAVTVASGATLDLNSFNQTIGSLAGAGSVKLGLASLTAGGDNSSTTFSGDISGAGGFAKTGNGTMTLTGANSYSGGTTINGGTLQLGNGGTSGSIVGNVVDNGTFAINRSDDVTFAGVISGTGNFKQVGTGTTTLTGANSYSGGTTINGGTLQLGNGGTSGSIAGNVVDNGTLAINRSDDVTFAGAISGTGNFNQIGTGTTTLTAANSYSGGTTIIGGTLQLGNGGTSGSIVGNVVDNGTLAINRSDDVTFAGVISGTGNFKQVGTGTTTLTGANSYSGGTTINGGTLQLGNGGTSGSIVGNVVDNGTLAINRSDDVTFAGAISGTGNFNQIGTGTTTLTAANSYTGATNVTFGTLLVNGSIASSSLTTVGSGGTLGGSGTVGTTTIASGGTLAPGNSIGTINVAGNLTFKSGSAYSVEVSPIAADRTNVTGLATLAGTVYAAFQPGTYVGRSYSILSAAGGESGRFESLNVSGLGPGFSASLNYTTTDVLLALNAILGVGTNLNINQTNVANSINNYFNNGGALPPGFQTVFGLTGTGLGNALTQLSGEGNTGAQRGAFQIMNSFMSLLLDPYAENRGGDFGMATGFAPKHSAIPSDIADASEAVRKAPAANAPRFNVWAAGFGGANQTNGELRVGSHDTTTHASAFAAGVDFRLSPDTLVGFSLAGGGTSWSLSGGLGGGRTDVFQVGVYGAHRIGAAYLSGALAFAEYSASTDRTVMVAGTDRLNAAFNAQSYGARLESGYHYYMTPFTLTPYGALQLQSFNSPTYSESVAFGPSQFALSYNSQTGTQSRAELGSWADKTFRIADDIALNLLGRVAWAHDWQSNVSLGAIFLGLPTASFVVNGAAPPADLALVTAGAELRLRNGWSLLGKFDGEFSNRSQTYAGTGMARYHW
jgi:autotransporter-associated beta strand protein